MMMNKNEVKGKITRTGMKLHIKKYFKTLSVCSKVYSVRWMSDDQRHTKFSKNRRGGINHD
ncbi:hypothetical protein [Sutcliffiella cohnii]|uniref:hypothetical protein n=1 Tax=Sutcliffiella cohnii TaxID=33932 RepID=UPI002E1FE772|nr:hypothetical protein [Sutcliffiella cohnii]